MNTGDWITVTDIERLGEDNWNKFREHLRSKHLRISDQYGRYSSIKTDPEYLFVNLDRYGDLCFNNNRSFGEQHTYEMIMKTIGQTNSSSTQNPLLELINTSGIKVRVLSREHSEQVQDVLFSLGIRRMDGSNEYFEDYRKYIYCDRDVLSHGMLDDTFNNDTGVEVELKMTLVPVKQEDLIEIDGKKYRREEVLGLLSGLKEVGSTENSV